MGGDCTGAFDFDPLITIASATDANSAAPLRNLTLSAFSINGNTIGIAQLKTVSRNVVVTADSLQCAVSCAFSGTEGLYSFIASAQGYTPKLVSIDARYTYSKEGCTTKAKGGPVLSISLSRS